MRKEMSDYKIDVLIIGGGIAGQESALNLANMGFKVLIVEKDLSLGGKMIHLSMVFPTLDCAACIATPKVSETARHPNISILTYAEVSKVDRNQNLTFKVSIIKKPRYVDEKLCTGCQDCEDKCPVVVEDQYQTNCYNLHGPESRKEQPFLHQTA